MHKVTVTSRNLHKHIINLEIEAGALLIVTNLQPNVASELYTEIVC